MMHLLRWRNGLLGALFAALLFASCGSQRQLADSTPAWVTERPAMPGYYLGIASTSKAQHPFNAAEVAKSRALSALAGEISVKVEATSVLNTLQRDARVSQRFEEDIRSSSQEDLEGYELVGVHETDSEVWAYYRLNKATYDRIKAERKSAAVAVAAGFYEAGLAAEQSRDVGSALDRFVRGLSALERYWGEVNWWQNAAGERVAVDQACLIGINRVLNGLRLEASVSEVELGFGTHYRGEVVVQTLLEGGAVPNLPLIARYSRGTLPHRKVVRTNGDGMAAVVIDGFDPGVRRAELRVNIDVDALMPELPGLAVQALIDGLEAPELLVPIRLVEPTVFISGRESAFGGPTRDRALQQALSSALSERGVRITDSEAQADLIIELTSDTQQGGQGQGFHTALLNASIQLMDRNGDLVLHKTMDRVKGVQLSWDAASQAAYTKASMEIRGSFLQEMLESLYQ